MSIHIEFVALSGQQTLVELHASRTNEVCTMYIEEFILVDIWIHCCASWKWICIGNAVVYIQSQQWKRNVRIALRSQLTCED